MNLVQLTFLTKRITGLSNHFNLEQNYMEPAILYASQEDSSGGQGGEKTGRQEVEESQASDDKRAKTNTGRDKDIANKAKDEKENASITEPDTNLTGDTGNLDIGQTDLGASGTGAEDL